MIAILFALGFLFIPRVISRLYGVTSGWDTLLVFRYFGVALLGVGLIFWFAKDIKDADARNAILSGAGIANQVGLLVSLYGTTSGIMNALGWLVVLIYAFLIAGCIYFHGDQQRVFKLKLK